MDRDLVPGSHHSTALEGNILVLQQVEVLLAEGRAVGNKQLREYMEVRGYADAARWVYGQTLEPGDWRTDTPLSLTEVRTSHELALGPAWEVAPHPHATTTESPEASASTTSSRFRRDDTSIVGPRSRDHDGLGQVTVIDRLGDECDRGCSCSSRGVRACVRSNRRRFGPCEPLATGCDRYNAKPLVPDPLGHRVDPPPLLPCDGPVQVVRRAVEPAIEITEK